MPGCASRSRGERHCRHASGFAQGGFAGLYQADWVGLAHFQRFFDLPNFWTVPTQFLTGAAAAAGGKRRLVGIDAARGLALIGMVSIHILPAWDPETFAPTAQWTLFAGRSAALFALLAGVSLAFTSGGRTAHSGRAMTATRAGILVRAGLITALGLAMLLGRFLPIVLVLALARVTGEMGTATARGRGETVEGRLGEVDVPVLDERARRLWAAAEARAIGRRGGCRPRVPTPAQKVACRQSGPRSNTPGPAELCGGG